MDIESTHSIEFAVNIIEHDVPDGAAKVVSQQFWGFDGAYGNVPREMVVEVQALGTEFLSSLVDLGKSYNLEKRAKKDA